MDILAKINDGDKLYLDKNKVIQIDEPYIFRGLTRYYNGSNRNDAIHTLIKLFNDIVYNLNKDYDNIKNNSNKTIQMNNTTLQCKNQSCCF